MKDMDTRFRCVSPYKAGAVYTDICGRPYLILTDQAQPRPTNVGIERSDYIRYREQPKYVISSRWPAQIQSGRV